MDASALVKRYIQEPESAEVKTWMTQNLAAISRLSELEVISALCRRCREGHFDVKDRDRAIKALRQDLNAFFVVELTPEVQKRSRQLLSDHPLRTGDALQLGACLELQLRLRIPATFIAFDVRLREAAQDEGLAVFPET